MEGLSGESETARRRSWLANLLILFAILLGVTIVGLLLVWALTPKQSEASAIFRISRERPTTFADESEKRYDEQEYQIFKKSQLALVRTYFVLTAAVRKPGISSLSTFAGKEDPQDWLIENLEVEYPQDGEYLSISLKGSESQMDDFVQIVDAMATAYSDEAIYKERSRRASLKDMKTRNLEDLQNKIADKWKNYYALAEESGRHAAVGLRQLYLDRLGRVDAELMRLEDEQRKQEGGGEQSDSKSYETRISQLRERQAELEKQFIQLTEPSLELDTLKAEIRLLRGIADKLQLQAEMMSMDSNAPHRIEQVQKAVVLLAE